MVGLEILVKIHPEKRYEFLQTFDLMTSENQKPLGCLNQALFEKSQEPNVFLWSANWESDASLASYRKTSQYKSLMGAMEVLGSLTWTRKFTVTEEASP